MASKKKQKEKKKDFVKQKLKVGKGNLKAANATDTSFSVKTLNVPTQQLGAGTSDSQLKNQVSLLQHHQTVIRRQAVLYITEHQHLFPTQFSTLITAIVPLIVDAEQTVRQAVLKFFKSLESEKFDSFISVILLYIHSAMTHITPAIRAESTLFLDVLLEKNPLETIRQGFVRTLELFLTLFGFSAVNKSTAAGSMATTTMSFGKSAGKTKLVHMKSFQTLLELGLKPEQQVQTDLYHPDTDAFMMPNISLPYTFGSRVITEDSDARRSVVEQINDQLCAGLGLSVKEGGELGRVASRLLTLVN